MGKTSSRKWQARFDRFQAQFRRVQTELVEISNKQKSWVESPLFWEALGIVGSIICTVVGIVMGLRLLLVFAWPFLAIILWMITCSIQSRTRKIFFLLPSLLVLISGHLWLDNQLHGSFILKATPYIIIRHLPGNDEIPSSVFYGFSIILYVKNTTANPQTVSQLEIGGEVPIDFDEYVGIGNNDGRNMDEIGAEYVHRQPYYNLSLVERPTGNGHIEANSEGFIKFDLIKPNTFGARFSNEPWEDYVGYKVDGIVPKKSITEPNLKDLVKFNRREQRGLKEWRGPKLREEIATGKVKFFVALLDASKIEISPSSINPVQRTFEKTWKEANLGSLYDRGVYGYAIDRKASPGHDPAIHP